MRRRGRGLTIIGRFTEQLALASTTDRVDSGRDESRHSELVCFEREGKVKESGEEKESETESSARPQNFSGYIGSNVPQLFRLNHSARELSP